MSSPEPRTDDLSRVGATFVKGYYLQLAQDPQGLANYYSKDSCLTVIDGPSSMEHPQVVHGPQEIMAQIKSLAFHDVKTRLSSVVFQPSLQGGVLVITTGAISSGDEKFRGFTQIFVLAKRKEKQYYIQNEALYLIHPVEEEGEAEAEEEEEEEEAQAPEPTYEEPTAPEVPQAAVETEPATNWADDEPVEATPQAEPEVQEAAVEVQEEPSAPAPPAAPVAPAPAPPSAPATAPSRPAAREEHREGERQTFAEILRHTAASSAPWGAVQRTTATASTAPRPVAATVAAPPKPAPQRRQQQPAAPKPAARPTVGSKSPSVYVARVPMGTTEEILIETFSKYGQVVQVRNREAKRIAFVDFASDEGVQKAIVAAADGLIVIKGQNLVVQAQKEKEEIVPRESHHQAAEDEEPWAGKPGGERRGRRGEGRGRRGQGRDGRGRGQQSV